METHVLTAVSDTDSNVRVSVTVASNGTVTPPEGIKLLDGSYSLLDNDNDKLIGAFEVIDGIVCLAYEVVTVHIDLAALFGQPVRRKLTPAEQNTYDLNRLQLCLDVVSGKLAICEHCLYVHDYWQYGQVEKGHARQYFLQQTTKAYDEARWYMLMGLLQAPSHVLSHLGYKDADEIKDVLERLSFFLDQRVILLAEDAAAAEANAAKPADESTDTTPPPPASNTPEEGTSPA